jgi:phenylpyruvate tautomerase PptA (4-oxalocrotonate tautomerase family)
MGVAMPMVKVKVLSRRARRAGTKRLADSLQDLPCQLR